MKIIKQFSQALNPRGYLFLGASESLSSLNNDFDMVRCNPGIVYRKKSDYKFWPEFCLVFAISEKQDGNNGNQLR